MGRGDGCTHRRGGNEERSATSGHVNATTLNMRTWHVLRFNENSGSRLGGSSSVWVCRGPEARRPPPLVPSRVRTCLETRPPTLDPMFTLQQKHVFCDAVERGYLLLVV